MRWVVIKSTRRPQSELETIADEVAGILGEETGIRIQDELTGEILYERGSRPRSDGVLLAELSPGSEKP